MIKFKHLRRDSRALPLQSTLTCGLLAAALALGGCSRSATEFMEEGKSFSEKGDMSAAIISYKNAVQKEDSVAARVTLGELLERNDDASGAEQQYRRALELGGDADELTPRIAQLLLDRGESSNLIRDFAKTELKSETADADLRGILALGYIALGQHREAAEQIEMARVKTAAVHLAQAQVALIGKRREQAAAELDAAVKDGKAPWWIWRAASRIYLINGERPKAEEALKRAYELAPGHHGMVGEYAEWLVGTGRGAEARKLLPKLNKIAPNYYRTIYLNALFQMEDGRFDDAWTLATKLLAKLPEHAPSQLIAATVELQRGELASVESRLTKVLARDPNAVQALRLRAFLELARGDRSAADATLAKALKIAPSHKELRSIAAELDWTRGNKDAAIKQMEAAAELPPSQARVVARLADMQFAAGKRAESQATIVKALDLVKTDHAHSEDVFRVLFLMHDLDKAKALAQAEIARDAKNPAPLVWLAAVLGVEGNQPASLEKVRQALDLRGDYFPALAAMAVMAKDPERTKEYETRLQKAVDGNSKEVRVYFEQANRLLKTGAEPSRIIAVYEKGVAANPNSVKLREALAKAKGEKPATAEASDGKPAIAPAPAPVARP